MLTLLIIAGVFIATIAFGILLGHMCKIGKDPSEDGE